MTEPQHMHALANANTVRRRRRELHNEVVALENDSARSLLADMLDYGYSTHTDIRRALKSLHAVEALGWVPHMRPSIAARYVVATGASEYRTIGELSDRQRVLLAELLRGGSDALRNAEGQAA